MPDPSFAPFDTLFDAPASAVNFPDPLISGDTWTFSISAGNYGDGTFTSSITFAALANKLTAPGTLAGGFFMWVIPGSQTSALTPQPYLFNINVTDSLGNRTTLQNGGVQVAADISVTGTNISNQTNLQQMLAACDATLIQLLSQKTSMVEFQGQAYHFQDISKLFAVRQYLASLVADEQQELTGNRRSNRIVCVFRNI